MEYFIKSSFSDVDRAVVDLRKGIVSHCKGNKSAAYQIEFVLRELLNNAVEHGNRFAEDKLIFLKFDISSNFVSISVRDEGLGFVPNRDYGFDSDLDLEERTRGIRSILHMGWDLQVLDCDVRISKYIGGEAMDIEKKEKALVLTPRKDLLASTIGELMQLASDTFSGELEGIREVVLDCSFISFIDSRGISFIVALYKSSKTKELDFKLHGLSQEMYDLCTMMKLEEYFELALRR